MALLVYNEWLIVILGESAAESSSFGARRSELHCGPVVFQLCNLRQGTFQNFISL